MNNLESAAIAEPKILPFIVGRAKKQWNRNVVAVGLSSRTLTKDNLDIFLESSWLQVMLGQGVMPEDYHPLAGTLTDEQLLDKLAKTKETKTQPMAKMPSHDEFLEMFGKVS